MLKLEIHKICEHVKNKENIIGRVSFLIFPVFHMINFINCKLQYL